MAARYKLYGWKVSPYTQKVAACFRYKRVPFQEVAPGILKLSREIPRHVGKMVMPTVETPDGQWWQDSSEIIDHAEAIYPERAVYPSSPRQRIVANLLELHGDEWLCLAALHYRWTTPDNYQFAIREFGQNSLPWAPAFLQKIVGEHIGKKMRSYMPKLGITGPAAKGLEAYTVKLLGLLEEHLKLYPFMLGSKPCIGDFALFGPLWAHLFRDPGTTSMFDDLPAVRSWFDRLLNPIPEEGEYLAGDKIPETLSPILSGIFSEQFEFCRKVIDGVDRYVELHPEARRVPRVVGQGNFCIGGVEGSRLQLTYLQWMVQRSLSALDQVPEEQRENVSVWLQKLGGSHFVQTRIRHPLKRTNYKEVLA